MPKFNEDALSSWTRPASDSEETKLANAERMVRETINANNKLNNYAIEIFGQGSYANDTNVRLNSDIDINVCYNGGFYYELTSNLTREDLGIQPSLYSYTDFKNDVESALVSTFGRSCVIRNDKCITVLENSYRVETDVVPTWSYRRYFEDRSYNEGVYFKTDSGIWINSYPKQHIKNGKQKNSATAKRFKRLTRIYRKLRYKMIDDNVNVSNNITSFLLECLVWNIPDNVFNDNLSWTSRLKESIIYLYNQVIEESKCKGWVEVSEWLYLFHSQRKWTRTDVSNYLIQMWNYLQLNQQ